MKNIKRAETRIKEFNDKNYDPTSYLLDLDILNDRYQNELTDWQRVLIARDPKRPTALQYIDNIFTDFIEFHGDRYYGDDKAIIGGIGFLEKLAVTIIGVQKGQEADENILRNFGMPHPEGYRKARRLMKQAEKFKRPIVIFINTPGAYPGFGAEERGQGQAIASSLVDMMNLQVPVISIIIGEGGSGGALALAVANKVWMLENSIYSVLTPEGYASILYKDASLASEVASAMKITSDALKKMNIIDHVISERGDINENFDLICQDIKNTLVNEFTRLNTYSGSVLQKKRYDRFRKF